MKKSIIIALCLSLTASYAHAGGFVTNTNQNVVFLRNPAQNAAIGVQGAYFNPAGIGFMNDGWHLSLDVQTVVQRRHTTSTFEPLKYGIDNEGKGYKKYTGKTFAPVLPHLDLAYIQGKVFGSFHFGVVSGGGKAKYSEGLGSFEAPVAMIPLLVNNLAGTTMVTGYDADIHLTGEQYNFAGQINLGYKITPKLSVSAGLRVNYISNYYNGSLENIQLQYDGNMVPAEDVLSVAILSLSKGLYTYAGGLSNDKRLDAHQKDIAFTPVISVDYKVGKFNFAGRYEFNTRVRLKNDTKENSTGISQFDDDKKVAADIPATLNLGIQYSVLPKLRISLGLNRYFDKESKQYNNETGKNDKQQYIAHNSYEILSGIEYDLSERVTLSLGGHNSSFGLGNDAKFISDMSYNVSSFSGGIGARIRLNSKMSIDAGLYKTFYEHLTKEQADYGGNGALIASKLSPLVSMLAPSVPGLAEKLDINNLRIPGKDDFYRTSIAWGIGISYDF